MRWFDRLGARRAPPRLLGATLWLATAVGCSSWELMEPKTPPVAPFAAIPASVGQICALRPHWAAAAVTFVVRDNGFLVGATRGPSYFCWYAKPGIHVLSSEADDVEELRVEVIVGGRYFLHQGVKNLLGHVTSPLRWVGQDEAFGMVEKCTYKVLVGTPGPEPVPPAAPVVPGARKG